jgi:cysteine desulfurase
VTGRECLGITCVRQMESVQISGAFRATLVFSRALRTGSSACRACWATPLSTTFHNASAEAAIVTIYLDCNATTPIDPEVLSIVAHYMEIEFGNAGSRTHEYGVRAKKAVEKAREQVSELVAAEPDEVVFTSGATESNNIALLGLREEGSRTGRKHIISGQIEHKAVLEPLEHLQEHHGFEVTFLPPVAGGFVSPSDLREALREDTLLVSLMHVNNETGVAQPLEEYCEALDGHESYFHVDAAQGFGKVAGLEHPRLDLISVSGHKIYAPKGVGALIARKRKWTRVPLAPLMFGGGQEHGLRPGTVAVPLVAGLGEAAKQAKKYRNERTEKCLGTRSMILDELTRLTPRFNGDQERVVPTTLSFSLAGVDAEAVIVALRGSVGVSNGSACTSHSYQPSHVLVAMGLAESVVEGTIRVSWCHLTDWEPGSLAGGLAGLV